ncbi:MAG: nitrous oxide reductase accessory protein NosL, partial [Saprospiraceae bacterium]|nr:nitrous oxide reductase accessory protein NosL [Saprospiraceae bacterium]
FIEFTVLPYLLGFFALLPLIVIFVNKTKYVLWLLLLFIAFGVSAIFDFWHWEYVYGHNLDPNAAIIVPGMAYQPPLIGFKQLLNFGAFSFPDLGGWSLFIGGFLILIVYILSSGIFNKFLGIKVASAILLFSFISCQTHLPEEIRLNKDNCANCKMTITDGHFATELVTKKGRVYKFDDIKCMLAFKKAEPDKVASKHFVNNYAEDNKLIPAESAFYIKGGLVVSPMAGNIAAFENKEKALQFNNKLKGVLLSWNDILNQK